MSEVVEMTPEQSARLGVRQIRLALKDPAHTEAYLQAALVLLRQFDDEEE